MKFPRRNLPLAASAIPQQCPSRWRLPACIAFGLALALLATNTPAAPPGAKSFANAVVGDRLVLSNSLKEIAANPAVAEPRQAALTGSTLTQTQLDSRVGFEVTLKMRDLLGLERKLASGKKVSSKELRRSHLPLETDFAAVEAWLISEGFAVSARDSHRLAIFASGTVAQVQSSFQTRFAEVVFEGKNYVAAYTVPSVPGALAGVLGVTGFQPYQKHRAFHSKVQPAQNGGQYYLTGEILGAYDAAGLGLTGSGEEIGIVVDAAPLDDDLTAFWTACNVSQSLSNLSTENTPNVSGNTPDERSVASTLDAEWSSGIASAAAVHIYVTGDLTSVNADAAYSTIANELQAGSRPGFHELSLNYGSPESDYSSDNLSSDEQYFATITSYGVSIFAPSGNNGAFGSSGEPMVSYPASDPNVTGVGGTSLVAADDTGEVSRETAWTTDGTGSLDGELDATGGGVSAAIARPSWQVGSGVPSGSTRCVPDVACAADQNHAALVVFTDPDSGSQADDFYGGTGWSTATWAGFCALLNEARANTGQAPLGLLNPQLYPLLGTNGFRDITTGNNSHANQSDGYNATVGYDLTTGLGVPDIYALVTLLGGFIQPPANDDFANAQILSSGTSGSVSGTNVGATKEPGEPDHAGNSGGASVWYSWTPQANGSVTFDTFPSDFDTLLAVYTGDSVSDLTVVVGDDDASTTNDRSTVTFAAQAGVTYYIAVDGYQGATGTVGLEFQQTPDTDAPVITSPTSATAKVGTAFSYQITAENSPTSYSASGLPTGLSLDTASGLISGTPVNSGTATITITASNTYGTGSAPLTIVIDPDAAPVITSPDSATVKVGAAFSYQITAKNSPTSYAAPGLPTGLSINTTTGQITGTPKNAGTAKVTISAANSIGTGSEYLTITITPAGAPVITSSTSVKAKAGTAFSYQIVATNAPTGYGASGLPTGLSVNTSTGVISGTPRNAGTATITISATNSVGTDQVKLTITISPSAPPVITSSTSATAKVGTSFSYQIVATNVPTSYGASGLPTGLAVDISTGKITGTPRNAGTAAITISASNSLGTDKAKLTIKISPSAPPVITSSSSATAKAGTAFTYQIVATNTPTSYGASGLPTGLAVNTSTGKITGTPRNAGTATITISASNALGSDTARVTITISPSAPPVITSSSSATAKVGTAFTYQIVATNAPKSYAASGLPTGLSVDTTTGVISGTPRNAGTATITISATNSVGTGTAKLTMTINPSAVPVITSATSVSAQEGAAFTYQITATNNPQSYTASGLPTGLELNTTTGKITGTPTNAGTTTVTIGARNAAGTGTAQLSIRVTGKN